MLKARQGDAVRAGDAILELHYRDRARLDAALALTGAAITIGDAAPPARRLILDEVR